MVELIRREASRDFSFFVENVFSKSFSNFTKGSHVKHVCNTLQNNPYSIRVSARVHFKSMSLYAHVMWKILRMRYDNESSENHYFSYKAEMAAYHVGNRSNQNNIRTLLKNNPYFYDLIDNKPQAEALIDCSWEKDGPTYTLNPHGMLTFKRGLHCNGTLYVDDALQDPSEKLDPRTVYKINDIFYTQLLDIPIGDKAEIHVVGTAQTEEDFYFDERSKHIFHVEVLPGVSDIKADEYGFIVEGTPLWPEWMSLDDHKIKQRSQGIKVYAQEYLCSPVYSQDAFIEKWKLDALVGQENLSEFKPEAHEAIYGGWDLGKHTHPAHFSVNVFKDGKARQIHDKWFDGENYTNQLEYIEGMMDKLNIEAVYYDNTRGELEALDEQQMLPVGLVPVTFNLKTKSALANEMLRYIDNKRWSIIGDQRSISQISLVTNDLKARETKQGHGDSFWSNALTFGWTMEALADIYIISS